MNKPLPNPTKQKYRDNFERIFGTVCDIFGHDFSDYTRATCKKCDEPRPATLPVATESD